MNERERSQKVTEIFESVLSRIQNGEEIDFEEILAAHPVLEPLLRRRLNVLKQCVDDGSIAELTPGASDSTDQGGGSRVSSIGFDPEESQFRSQFDATGQTRSDCFGPSNGPTFAGGQTLTNVIEFDCVKCGAAIESHDDSIDDVTCINCGHVVPFGMREPRFHAPIDLRLDNFKLLDCIGRGGFGFVYKAKDLLLDRYVAIKIPRPNVYLNPDHLERFTREARNAARLSHPGIVPVYEVGQDGDNTFIVSKFIDGFPLSDLIAIRRLEFPVSVALMKRISEAVGFAHQNQVVHRDLKPSNILLDRDRSPYVCDFGLSRASEGETTVTLEGAVMGTPAYMSPEQAVGEQSKIGPQTDIYSLGVIFYRLLTGELPFRGGKKVILHQILHDDPIPPRKIDGKIPLDLETITLKAMAKEPDRRYQSANELGQDLERYLRGEPIVARPVSRLEKTLLWCRRKPVIASLIATVAILLMVSSIGGATWGYRESIHASNLETAFFGESMQRTRADKAARESERLLARQYTLTGVQSLAEADNLRALPWLTKAWEIEQSDPDRDAIHRLRIGMTLQQSPKLVSIKGGGSIPTSAIFSPAGRLAAAGFLNGNVFVWEVATGNIVLDLKGAGDSDSVSQIAFSHDGSLLAIARHFGIAEIWHVKQCKQIGTDLVHVDERWTTQPTVFSIEFSPDDRKVVTRTRNNRAFVWDVHSSNLIAILVHQGLLRQVAFSDDMTLYSSEYNSKNLGKWKLDPQRDVLDKTDLELMIDQPVFELEHSTIVRSFEIDQTRKRLMVYCDTGTSIWLTDSNSMTPDVFVKQRVQAVSGLMIDDQRFLTVLNSGEIQSWDVSGDEPAMGEIDTKDGVRRVRFSLDKKLVCIASEGNDVFVWRTDPPGLACANLPHSDRVSDVRISRGGRYVMTFGVDGLVKIWDIKSSLQTAPRVQGKKHFSRISFSHDSSQVAIAGLDHFAYLRSTVDGTIIGRPLEHPDLVIDVDFSPDGTKLATACYDNQVRIWDTKTFEQILIQPMMHLCEVIRVAFSKDGRYLVSGDKNGGGNVWNAETGERKFECSHDNMLLCISFSPDGRKFATAAADGQAKVWDLESERLAFEPLQHGQPPLVMSCRFSPDGSKIITGAQDRVCCLWDANTGEPISNPLQHNASVWDARFHPTKDRLLTASFNGQVSIWEHINHPELKTRVHTYGSQIHASSSGFSFALDGRVFMSPTDVPVSPEKDRRRAEGGIELWDADTGDLVSPLLPHYDKLNDAVFSPDNRWIVACDHSCLLRFWKIKSEERSLEELKLIAGVLSGYEVEPDKGLVPLNPKSVLEMWAALRKRDVPEVSASDFSPDNSWIVEPVPLTHPSPLVGQTQLVK